MKVVYYIIENDGAEEIDPVCTNIDQAIYNLVKIKNERHIKTLPFTKDKNGDIHYKEEK